MAQMQPGRATQRSTITTLSHQGSTTMNPQLNCHLFRLLRKLRDVIYEIYVIVPGGDLALSRSCQRIAEEMDGISLTRNNIVFQSFCGARYSTGAGVLHATVHRFEEAKWYKVCHVGPALITEPIKAMVKSRYPQFERVVDGLGPLRNQRFGDQLVFSQYEKNSWGETPSVYRDFSGYLYELASQNSQWSALSKELAQGTSIVDLLESIDNATRPPEPWAVFTEQDVKDTKASLYPEQAWEDMVFTRPVTSYVISAATLAIKFLRSAPGNRRNLIRHIGLREEEGAVAYPECHGQGLIPHCQENPNLHVHRVVDLWKTVLPSPGYGWRPRCRGLVIESVASWIVEARSLSMLGMPDNCFTLSMDGSMFAANATKLFDEVSRTLTEQKAMERFFAEEMGSREDWLALQIRPAFKDHHVL